MGNSKIDSEATQFWKFLLKLALPIILLSCKAKIEQNKIAVINHKSEVCDTCEYRWQDEFTQQELNELNLK